MSWKSCFENPEHGSVGIPEHPNTWDSDLFDDVLYHNGKQKEVPGYATDVWFNHGTEFARQCHKHNEPFFLYLALNAPHGPLFAPDRFREPYRHLDKPTATFFAMIATVDYRLGEFVKMLEAEGMRDNTILVFLTDNGTANGEKIHNAGMRGKKGSLYEGGHRVPCIYRAGRRLSYQPAPLAAGIRTGNMRCG